MPTPAELGAHISADPNGRGFAALVTAGNHQGVAEQLNDPTFGTINDFRFTAEQLRDAIDTGELAALSSVKSDALQMLMMDAAAGHPINADAGTSGRDWLTAIFGQPADSTTIQNLQAIAQRPASEAELTWGLDTAITAQQVAEALDVS